jgi:uncharacterized membrane protein
MDQNKNFKKWFQLGTQQCGILCGLIGVLVALCFIFFGFWRTLLIALLFVVGYAVGAYGNKAAALNNDNDD